MFSLEARKQKQYEKACTLCIGSAQIGIIAHAASANLC